jgi:hypothetical protein
MDISSNMIWSNYQGETIDSALIADAETVGASESITLTIGMDVEDPETEFTNIIDRDFVANPVATDELDEDYHYTWEGDFFKQFSWLKGQDDGGGDDDIELDIQSIPQTERMRVFLQCCKLVENKNKSMLEDENEMSDDAYAAPLYMYYVSLENQKLMLHVDFKKEYDTIISDCEKLYEYVKINRPIRVIYVTEVQDLYDIDKDVKLYMNMFGVDNTRGGSYTDVELPDYLLKAFTHEQQIVDIEYYVNRII